MPMMIMLDSVLILNIRSLENIYVTRSKFKNKKVKLLVFLIKLFQKKIFFSMIRKERTTNKWFKLGNENKHFYIESIPVEKKK